MLAFSRGRAASPGLPSTPPMFYYPHRNWSGFVLVSTSKHLCVIEA